MPPRESQAQPDSERTRPEQVFFEDPALDRLMGVVLALATEHSVLREQVRALEKVLARRGLFGSAEDEAAASAPDPEAQQEAAAFAEALMRPLLGVQQASGATGTFTLAGRRKP